jgi:heat shock protein HslJ
MNAKRMILALVSVAMACASVGSVFSFADGQKPAGGNPLNGTSWQLVRFKDYDDQTFTPDDRSKYTITFNRNGRVVARVDCNRASSTWKATEKGELQFGSWSRTSARCGSGSLHDRIVTEGANVTRFAIKNGHLFLLGMAAGGYYELEPAPAPKR